MCIRDRINFKAKAGTRGAAPDEGTRVSVRPGASGAPLSQAFRAKVVRVALKKVKLVLIHGETRDLCGAVAGAEKGGPIVDGPIRDTIPTPDLLTAVGGGVTVHEVETTQLIDGYVTGITMGHSASRNRGADVILEI